MTIYLIIDTEIDPEAADENGMSAAFVKSAKTGRILRTKESISASPNSRFSPSISTPTLSKS